METTWNCCYNHCQLKQWDIVLRRRDRSLSAALTVFLLMGEKEHWTRNQIRRESEKHTSSGKSLNFLNLIFIFIFNTKNTLYWGLADEQCCASSRWTVKRLTHIYVYPLSPRPLSHPIQAAAEHWAEFPVPYNRSLLVIHFKYSSVYLWTSDSLTVPSPWKPEVRSLWVYLRTLFKCQKFPWCPPNCVCWPAKSYYELKNTFWFALRFKRKPQ